MRISHTRDGRRRGPLWQPGSAAFGAIAAFILVASGFSTALPGAARSSDSSAARLASKTSTPFTIVIPNPWTPWTNNQFGATFPSGYVDDDIVLPLAMQTPANLTSFLPQIAVSWKLQGTKFTVNLRRDARWQDGAALTSKDVVDAALLEGVVGAAVWQDIKGVTAPTSRRVVFDLVPSASTATSEANILDIYPVPASEYGRFVTPGLGRLIETYYAMARTNPTAAAKSSAAATISKDDAALVKFAPTKLLGDGPFRLTAETTAQLKLLKWSGFWAAKNIHVPEIIWDNGTLNDNAAQFLTGGADFTWDGFTKTIYEREMHGKGTHIYSEPNYEQGTIYFNDSKYPLNNVHVRQAIAYVIHRLNLDKLSFGGLSFNTPVQRPSLMFYSLEHQYLSDKQINSLNSYSYNPTKAAALLTQAGFHKVGGVWRLPDGKPFTLTADGPSQWTAPDLVMKLIGGWLTAFGIKTTTSIVEQPGYWTYQFEGDFDLDWGWGTSGLNPLIGIDTVLGGINFPATGTYKGDRGIGFGPTMAVPGLGKVDIPQTINQEAATVGAGKKMDQLVWDWTKLVNQELPVMAFQDKNIPLQFATTRYSDWPRKSSGLWRLMGLNVVGGLSVMMEKGYIRPAK